MVRSKVSRQKAIHVRFGVKARNRCAIARCAGSPTTSTVAGVKIVDSARVALS